MPCFRGFGVFRGSLLFGDKSEYMVAAPGSRVGRRATEGEPRVRLFGFSPAVATCRQTVEALLATHHRLAADGYDSAADDSPSQDVATCRQTVEASLAPLSTTWQRMATIRAFPPILFVRNPPANRPNHRENRYNPEDRQHFLHPP